MQMYSCFLTLNQILLKYSLGKVVFVSSNFGHLAVLAKGNSFFGSHFETVHFFIVFIVVFRSIRVRCKFHTEIPTGKCSKMVRSKWTPMCTNGSEK